MPAALFIASLFFAATTLIAGDECGLFYFSPPCFFSTAGTDSDAGGLFYFSTCCFVFATSSAGHGFQP